MLPLRQTQISQRVEVGRGEKLGLGVGVKLTQPMQGRHKTAYQNFLSSVQIPLSEMQWVKHPETLEAITGACSLLVIAVGQRSP